MLLAFTAAALAVAGCAQEPTQATLLATDIPTDVPTPSQIAPTPTQIEPTPIPTLACTETEGSLHASEYRGIAVAQDVPYLVYLPPCYAERDQLYPTLYLLHGYPYDQGHWQALGAVEAANNAILNDDWPPFLMVMPLQPEPLYRGSDGGPGSYEMEFLDGLVLHIENELRSDPQARALAGISRGGVWALEIALNNPLQFEALAALSPALAVNSARAPYDPFEIAQTAELFPRNILLLVGDEDWARAETERLSGLLGERQVEHMLQITAGNHSDETWKSAMSDVLSFLIFGAIP